MPMMSTTPMLPAWIGLPIAGLALVVIAAHLLALQRSPDTPPLRKRIRTANGLLMMLVTTLLAYAFCVATPAQPTPFAMAWLAIIGLLAIVITVALLDAVHTVKLQLESRRQLRQDLTRPPLPPHHEKPPI